MRMTVRGLAGLASLAAALAALAAPAATAAATGPAGERAGATPRPQAAQIGEPQIDLVDQTTWLDEGQPFDARVRITRPPEGATMRVAVHDRLLSRAEFQRSLLGELGGVELEMGPVPVALLAPRAAGTLGIELPTDGTAGAALGEGVYPVEVQVLDAGGAAVVGFVTYVVVRPAPSPDFPSLAVSVVVDVGAPPALQPDGTVQLADEALDRIEERVAVLDGTRGVPLTLAPEPETLDGLASVGDEGQELLADLTAARAGRPVLARPYTDVDIAALMQANSIAELNAQADSGANVVRSRFATEPVPGIWLSDTTLGGPAARMVTDVGVGQAVVPPDAVGDVPGLEGGQVPAGTVRLGEGGPVTLVSDATLAERLTGDGGVLDAHRFVAELAMLWMERPAVERGVVIHLPAERALDAELVTIALTELSDSRILAPVELDTAFSLVPPADGEAPPVATPAPHQVTGDLSGVAGRLAGARSQVDGYDGALTGADAGRSLADSLLLATAADTPDRHRSAYVDRVYTVLNDLRDVIRAPSEFRITLTSRSGEIPLNLTNDSDQAVDVRIELESDQLEFSEGDVITTTLEPGGGNRIDIPVRTRASGAFPLTITVTSPDGSVVLETTRFDIRSTTVSGVGLVLSIGAGLFLAVWWARHWRRTRRAQRLVPTEDIPAVAPPGTPARGTPAAGAAGPGPPPARPQGPPGPPEPPGPAAASALPPGSPDPPGAPPLAAPDGAASPDRRGLRRRGRYRPAHMASDRSHRSRRR